jgi:Spy/CpxP family protein refolding chaperone
MKKLVTCIAAGLLVIGAQSLVAQTTTNSPTTPPSGEHQGQGKERMAALLKLLDLNPADMKALTPEERRAKMKERGQKIVADLQAKESAGTLTDEEKTRLEKVQKFLAHADHKKPATATPPANSQ